VTHDTDAKPLSAAEPIGLPGAGDWLSWVGQRCEGELAEAVRLVEQVKIGAAGAVDVVAAGEGGGPDVADADAVALWAEVHPDAAVRDRADELSQEVQKYVTELGQDRDLFAVFDRLDASELAGLDDDARRVLEHTLRDFRRAGVDRDDATRDRLRELSEQGVKLSQDFGRHIREDVRSIRVAPERLAGLPDDYREAHPADDPAADDPHGEGSSR
jgi:thimet oligopeptidase